ncbi:MAG: type II 3-dehydroquinate dehydratase [Anaerolineales bacterium]|nr:MAG: type II 3-dehydroquinate dehydratase [Anaerolineales bacterium]
MRILTVKGLNVHLSGAPEPERFGREGLRCIGERTSDCARQGSTGLLCASSRQGVLTEEQHRANADGFDGVVFNPGGLTFYSYALRDALTGLSCQL